MYRNKSVAALHTFRVSTIKFVARLVLHAYSITQPGRYDYNRVQCYCTDCVSTGVLCVLIREHSGDFFACVCGQKLTFNLLTFSDKTNI